MASSSDTAINALQNRANSLSNSLGASSTAYAPDTDPTESDLSKSTQLDSINKQIDTLKSTALRNEWYGKDTTGTGDVPVEDTGNSDGWLMSGLKALQRPLNAVAGAAQYVLGKGTDSDLFSNMNTAMKTGLTSGNILQQEGAPRWLQVPLGFALDVMFDPVNWATAGTSALIPRVGAGLLKGGLEEGALRSAADIAGKETAESGLKSAITNIGTRTGAALSGGWSPSKALEAGWTGLKSSLEKKGATAMRMIPFAHNIPGYAEATAKLGTKAIEGADKYDTLMGTSIYDKLGKGTLTGMPSGTIGKTAEGLIRKIPSVPLPAPLSIFGKMTPSGDDIADFFKYSPTSALGKAKLLDKVEQLGKEHGVLMERKEGDAHFINIEDFNKPGATVTLKDASSELANMAIKNADNAYTLSVRDANGVLNPDVAGRIKVFNSEENATFLLNEAEDTENLKNVVAAYKVPDYTKTGVAWYDDFITKMKSTSYNDIINYVGKPFGMTPRTSVEVEKAVQDGADQTVGVWNKLFGVPGKIADAAKTMTPGEWQPFNKLLTGINELTRIMKGVKTGMNIGSLVVNTLGNFVMGPMLGIPTYKAAYLKEMVNASKFLSNKLTPLELRNMFLGNANSLADMLEKNPNVFRKVSGVSSTEVVGKMSAEAKILGVLSGGDKWGEVKKFLYSEWIDAEESFNRVVKMEEDSTPMEIASAKKATGKYSTQTETLARLAKESPVRAGEKTSSFTENEVSNATLDQIRNSINRKVEENPTNMIYRAGQIVFDRLPAMYQRVDQIQKIATVNYITKVGLTEQELATLSKQINVGAEDMLEPTISGGEKLYRLTPLKATEAAMEAFMDYSAMPGFIQIMKSLPVLGAPFISFQYAMAIKMAKTAINNPAIFNKIGFMLDEMNASRTPEEKAAMEQKYNLYLKSPTVVKIMGMVNTDVKNIIPIYGINMFNPSERTYDNSAQGNFLRALDNLPIFQDPSGQIVKDFLIQPLVLSGTTQAPQGQFGQPIVPNYDANGNLINPSLGTRAFYAGRTAAESLTPGVFGYMGLISGGLPENVINLLPSYRARATAFAETGKSSVGATTKENAMVKTLRSVLGTSGIPAYTLDTTKSTPIKP